MADPELPKQDFKVYSRNNLPPHIVHHSPDGFNWGYGGSGPSELARCLLIDVVGVDLADRYYQEFKWKYVAGWENDWSITSTEINDWVGNKIEND